MAKNNSNLHSAKKGKNDEFYTQLSDIEKELRFYKPHFNGKIVLCNCNDALHTGFATYFSLNFEILGLKELICTSYDENGHGTVYRYFGDKNGNGIPDMSEWQKEEMKGNGSFNTPEGIALIEYADIICTNPPFSMFREFVALLEKCQKKYLLIANGNAITYKEIFPLFKENKAWLGITRQGTGSMWFMIPDDSEERNGQKIENGKRYQTIGNSIWFTNLDHSKRHETIDLYKKYSPEEFPKYDNYNAINVDKVCDIPLDFDEIMGVPITFLGKYCPEQFEIISIMTGSTGECFVNGNDSRAKFYVDNKGVYARILIRKKK